MKKLVEAKVFLEVRTYLKSIGINPDSPVYPGSDIKILDWYCFGGKEYIDKQVELLRSTRL